MNPPSTFIRLGWLRVFICATVQDDPALGNSGFWSRTVATVYQSLELLASSVETKESKDIWLWVWQWWRNLTVKNIITRMFSGTVRSRTFEKIFFLFDIVNTFFCENCPGWILWTWRLWDWCKLWNCSNFNMSALFLLTIALGWLSQAQRAMVVGQGLGNLSFFLF